MTRIFSGTELVIATHNKGKLEEIRGIFHRSDLKIMTASDLGLESPEETGTTFIENAILKARFVAEKSGKPAMADDSGLCVNALDGAPGVYSADWAETETGRDFGVAIKKVHAAMNSATDTRAQFFSVIALCWPDGHCETAEGIIPGNIVWPPRGEAGHGYDPIFMPEGHNRTFAEMTLEEKNKISHRAKSLAKMLDLCFR